MKIRSLTILFLLLLGFAACSQDDDAISISSSNTGNEDLHVYPIPPSGWMGQDAPYLTTGYVGDVMPFYENGKFHTFFLHDAAVKPEGKGFHAIHKFTSSNVSSFFYEGEQISYGQTDEPDFGIGTGSTVKVGNTYYFYYTGHNGNSSFIQNNPRESILLAKSTDLEHWEKDEDFIITASSDYSDFDFRDPHVFFNEETSEYWMLVSTQIKSSGKAVIILYTTTDPESGDWQLQQEPLYTTTEEENYLMLECADIFQMGGYWYLFFSENWNERATHYRIATSPFGPWTIPDNDMIDGEYHYAAKTASDGNNRYSFAWTARKFPENDNGNKEWAGNLVVHQIIQNEDGTLGYKVPGTTENLFIEKLSLELESQSGVVNRMESKYFLDGSSESASYLFQPEYGLKMLRTTLSITDPTGRAGFIFRKNSTTESAYKIFFEPNQNRIIAYYQQEEGSLQQINDVEIDLEAGQVYDLKLVMDGTVCVLYIDGKIAFSNRIYEMEGNPWGFLTEGTSAEFGQTLLLKP